MNLIGDNQVTWSNTIKFKVLQLCSVWVINLELTICFARIVRIVADTMVQFCGRAASYNIVVIVFCVSNFQLVCTVFVHNHQCNQPSVHSTISAFNHQCIQPSVHSTISAFNHQCIQPSVHSTISAFNRCPYGIHYSIFL